jgi:hypothetical protein
MKIMKSKVRTLLVAICLGLFGAIAMGSSSSDDGDKKIVTNGGGTGATGSDASQSDIDNDTAGNTEASSSKNITIDEQVLLDQNDIVITATDYVYDSIWGEGIKVLLENNSDQNITVGCNALIVNDYMITDLFSADVAAGKKSNETIYLSSSELEAAGIDVVGQVEMYFYVYDESWNKLFDSDCVTVQTSEYANMDTTPNDEGTELYNEGGIRIVGKTVDENSFWGTAILLYIENTSGRNVTIQCDDMSINGFMMTPYFSCDVYDGKKAIDDITIMSSELEDNGIESIDDVEMKFNIYDADTYDTIANSDVIKFSAK